MWFCISPLHVSCPTVASRSALVRMPRQLAEKGRRPGWPMCAAQRTCRAHHRSACSRVTVTSSGSMVLYSSFIGAPNSARSLGGARNTQLR